MNRYSFEKNHVLKRLTDSWNKCLGYIFRSNNLQELVKRFCAHLLLTTFPADGKFSTNYCNRYCWFVETQKIFLRQKHI